MAGGKRKLRLGLFSHRNVAAISGCRLAGFCPEGRSLGKAHERCHQTYPERNTNPYHIHSAVCQAIGSGMSNTIDQKFRSEQSRGPCKPQLYNFSPCIHSPGGKLYFLLLTAIKMREGARLDTHALSNFGSVLGNLVAQLTDLKRSSHNQAALLFVSAS